eukprot:gb/GECH01001144.1/.p1 GENE.gb/GECH01001144.1/~~gb/GECH01001144.1/.p1  ORF type:complete len:173 (+),score=32.46 gb/GECH01001144.1/:1-519(+)
MNCKLLSRLRARTELQTLYCVIIITGILLLIITTLLVITWILMVQGEIEASFLWPLISIIILFLCYLIIIGVCLYKIRKIHKNKNQHKNDTNSMQELQQIPPQQTESQIVESSSQHVRQNSRSLLLGELEDPIFAHNTAISGTPIPTSALAATSNGENQADEPLGGTDCPTK